MTENELNTAPEAPEEKRISAIKLIILTVIIIALIILLICFGPAILTILILNYGGTKYDSFNEKRTAEMERMFSITITDDIKPERYEHELSMFDHGDEHDLLEISGISSHEDFMENNVSGRIDSKTADGILTSYRDGEESHPIDNKDVINYVYFDSENNEIWVNFYVQEDGTYLARLNKRSQ